MADDSKELSQRILKILAERKGVGMRRSELRRETDCGRGEQAQRFKEVFRSLCAEGVLLRQRGGRYVPAQSRDLLAGTVHVTFRGFGFVTPREGAQDIFVPPQFLNGAISGDRVLVSLCDGEDERGPVGQIERITERVHRVMVASLVELPAGPAVRPLRRELPPFIMLAEHGHTVSPADVDPGDWVEVGLIPQDGPRAPLLAVILRRLAAADPITADLDAVAVEYGLPEAYSEAEQQAAGKQVAEPMPREDATALEVVTIDPVDAKDFDDGISLEPGERPGTVRIGVHIADVAAFVQPGSALDEGAQQRGFTAYLPGRTLPMLPRALSSWQCSLIAGEERLAHSVYLEIVEASGEVLTRRRTRTRIRVRQRLTFEDVGEILAQGRAPAAAAIPEDVVRTVCHLGEVASRLRALRATREAFLQLAVPEIRVLCGETPPRIHTLQRVDAGPAHELVEEFMLAANTAVAEELLALALPGLFRNHAEPRPADLVAFAEWARQTLGTRIPVLRDRAAVNHFIAAVAQTGLRDTVLAQFLRALPRAGYAATCQGHYGLGKAVYSHFTSPIRRYPDLLVHQQLLAHDLGRTARSAAECEGIGTACTSAEERVDSAYYAAVDRLKLRYLRDRQAQSPGELYEGIVSRCSSDGLTVYLAEVGMYGSVAISRLSGGPYRMDRRSGRLSGSHGGKSYKTGDVIYVQCRRADTVRGELTLEPVQGRI
jgi:ribonuclease R